MPVAKTSRAATPAVDTAGTADPSAVPAVLTGSPALPGDEIPPADPSTVTLVGDEPPAALVLPGDEPPAWVSPVDPRDEPIAHLMQPPLIRTVGGAAFTLPIPPLTGFSAPWVEDGAWFMVRADIYRRQVGDYAQQARAGDRVQVPDNARTADDVANGYLIPEE